MSTFLAGAAVRDITPPPGVPLWGYTTRTGPATGTLDPLFAKCVVFRAGGVTVALTVLDLGRVPAEEVVERIRERAARAGADYVFMTAVHTHHAPVMEFADAPHVQGIERAIGDCIEAAAANLQPAKVGVGRTSIDIAHNRRRILENGTCEMIWRNEARVPTAPVDPEAVIVRITTLDDAPLAVLVHFACHPVVMDASNYEYSADYVGELCRIVEAEHGGACLFLQGACGNINPYLDKTPLDAGGYDAMRAVGGECARAICGLLSAIEPVPPPQPSVAFSESMIEVGTRWDLTNEANRDLLREAYGEFYDVYARSHSNELAVPLGVVVLNNDIALVGMPGEIFVQYQLELKANAPLNNTLLCGYTNGYIGYFPTVRDAAARGYGGAEATFVGVGAGDELTTQAEVEIGRLSGRLDPVCRRSDFAVFSQADRAGLT
ncbi:MAG: hypothetical protein GWP08_11005 [Nitrospiraceae bacterium]|nr:hypothetical protein [Nitrospiraceae bacterium]